MPCLLPRAPRNRVGSATASSIRVALAATASATALLSGCAVYHAKPLPSSDSLLTQAALARVQIDPAKMPLPELAAHRFDPSDGFDMEDVAILAVANNPDLRLARDDLAVFAEDGFYAVA